MERQSLRSFLWSLPQPVFVFGSTVLAASALATQWMDSELLVMVLLYLPIPLFFMLERLFPRRRDWLQGPGDLLEDAFWILGGMYIWFPIFDEHYDTPISDIFVWLRDASDFPYRLEAETTSGLLVAGMVAIFVLEFITYWVHLAMHRFMFLWRIHATHHHLTQLTVAKSDRGHPLELLAINLGSVMTLAFLGASDGVVGVVFVFTITTGYVNHSNLPLESGIFGWLFNTAEMHQLHHSCDYAESDTNYGCAVILWDRIFGTFSGKKTIERAGNGTGRRLSVLTQLSIPFRSNEVLRNL